MCCCVLAMLQVVTTEREATRLWNQPRLLKVELWCESCQSQVSGSVDKGDFRLWLQSQRYGKSFLFFFFFLPLIDPATFALSSGQRGGAAADQQGPGGLGPDGCKVPPVERAQRGAGSGNWKSRQGQGLQRRRRLPSGGDAASFSTASSAFFSSASGGDDRSGASHSRDGRRLQAEPQRRGAVGGRRAVRRPPGHPEGLLEPGQQPGAGTLHRIAAGFNKQRAERSGHVRRRRRELFLHLGRKWKVEKATSEGARTLVGLTDLPGVPWNQHFSHVGRSCWNKHRATCSAQRNSLPSVDLSSASRERCLEKCDVQILSLPFSVLTVPSGATRFEVFCTSFSFGEKREKKKYLSDDFIIVLPWSLPGLRSSGGQCTLLDTRNCSTESTAVLCGRAASVLLGVAWMGVEQTVLGRPPSSLLLHTVTLFSAQ